MKKFFSFLSLVLVIGVNVFAQTPISPTTWGGTTPNTAPGPTAFSPLPASSTPGAAAVAVSQWNRGPGVSYNAGASRYNSNNWTVGTSSVMTVYGNGDYIYFSVTNNATTELKITGINIGVGQASATGPTTFGIVYQVGSGPITIFSPIAGGPSPTFSGTAVICGGQTATFYLCGWGGTGSAGTWSINNSAAITASYASAVSTIPVSSSPVTAGGTLIFSSSSSGGVTPYSYSWTGPLSFSAASPAPSIPSVTTAAAGTYSFAVTDAWGCSVEVTVPVVINPGGSCTGTPAAGTATPASSVFCGNGSTLLTLTGGTSSSDITYQWSSSATNTPPGTNIAGATASSYNASAVSSTTYYWCTSTCPASSSSAISAAATVSINPLPAISVTPAGGNVCESGSGLSMTASGAPGFTWAPSTGLSAITGATVTANPTSDITYTVSGTSAAGCVGTNTVNVTYSLNPSAVTVTPPSVAICQGTTQALAATGGLVGPTTINSGSVTIPSSIAPYGTISNDLLVAGIPSGATITDASINVIDFGSQYQNDYIINIKAPNGNIFNLITTRGSHTSTVTTIYGNTVLSSTGTTSLAFGSGTYTGTWLADAVSGVGGAPYVSNTALWNSLYSTPNGVWTLSIYNASGYTNAVIPSLQWSITLTYSYQSPITWSPVTDLYTDVAGTVPYTGGNVGTVYVKPSAAATTTYTATATNITCAATATSVVTANPLPAAITGNANVCLGLTTQLTETSTGGTWSNDASGNASIDASGLVTALLAGTADITYTLPTGCITTRTITVNPLPDPITGTMTVCQGLTTTLSETSAGGTWSTAPSGTVSINSLGTVTGNAAGTAIITYTLPTTCINTAIVTVNPLPNAITGTPEVCEGLTTSLTEITTGGTWSSSNGTGTATMLPAIGTATVTGGSAGTITVTYTLPTGCIMTQEVTVNQSPAAITGTANVCQGLTTSLSNAITGGTWASALPATATVDASGTVTGGIPGTVSVLYTLPAGCNTSVIVTVNPIPEPITGTFNVCQGLTTNLGETTPGGTWSSSIPANATIDPSGMVSGLSAGTSVVTYALAIGCIATTTITVNPPAAPISGIMSVCAGLSTTLTDAGGGTWSSSNANALAGLTTGLITGLAAGTSVITYTLPTSCKTTTVFTINPLPAPISGPTGICVAATTTLTNSAPGGTWSSSSSNAAIDVTSGVVTGVSEGASTITYKLPTGCIMLKPLSISPLPLPISGGNNFCQGTSITLTDASTSGSWSSSSPHAFINPTTGVVIGVSEGIATISYTIAAGCSSTKTITVNPIPYAIAGTPVACIGSSTLLLDSGGGTWSASNTNAVVGLTSGVVVGLAEGTVTITYTLPVTGCNTMRIVTVAALPAPITGAGAICEGVSIMLADTSSDGWWSTADANISIVASSGIATGVVNGTAKVTYTVPSGCTAYTIVTVNALPSSYLITGGGTYCSGTPGANVFLTGSEPGISYQLYNGAGTSGSPASGSGSLLDFGPRTMGTYTVIATNITTSCTNYMEGSVNITAIPSVIPEVTLATSTGSDVICSGTMTKFTATTANGGTLPNLFWTKNGLPLAISADTFSYIPSNGDIIKVKLVSNATCAIPDSAVSIHTLSVIPVVVPFVSVGTNPGTEVCSGSPVVFTATPYYGGTAPAYAWKLNGSFVSGSSGTSFSYTPANGDVVSCTLISNQQCRSRDSVFSSNINMTVMTPTPPSVSISVNPGTTFSAGQNVVLTANVTGGTPILSYQWSLNGNEIPGANGPTLTASNFTNNSVVSCAVTNSDVCSSTGSATVTLHVTNEVNNIIGTVVNLNIYPNPNKGVFTIKGTLNVNDDGNLAITITDMLGEVVYLGNIKANNGVINETIALSHTLANGMYLLNLNSESVNKTAHFIIEQ